MSWTRPALMAVLLALLLLGGSCEAATWTKLGQVNEGGVITGYIDKASLQEVPAIFTSLDKFEIWEKRTYSPPQMVHHKEVPEMLYFTQYRKNSQYCVKRSGTSSATAPACATPSPAKRSASHRTRSMNWSGTTSSRPMCLRCNN